MQYSNKIAITKSQCLIFQRKATTDVPDEVYSRNASCALNLISTFLWHLQKG